MMNDEPGFACHCCGFLTMDADQSGSFDICDVCGWEDDNVQLAKPDSYGGANRVSLNEAKANFAKFGAKSKEALPGVREPLPEEIPSR